MSLPLAVSPALVKAALLGSSAAAAALLTYVVASRETIVSRLATRYVHHLDSTLRSLFRPEIGRQIALVQVLLVGAGLVTHLVVDVPMGWVGLLVVILGPALYLRRERQERVARLELQVDGFVVALANSLKTVPSPAAALQATAAVLQQPTRQEIEHILKEMRVGSTLEQGLVAMSARVKSRWIDVAFSAVLIGLRVGGNLPVVLERTAATIREMNRLLGVVRTKTGEGRMQLWVLAGFPLFIVFAFNAAQKGYFDPLQHSLIGQITVGIAAILWIGSLLLARKILTVDV
ncbi:MAG TPA: type II secretion system F family protein [Labilithrix sp.]|nr:type II secretion system F family protein [Labilithrix sp.]